MGLGLGNIIWWVSGTVDFKIKYDATVIQNVKTIVKVTQKFTADVVATPSVAEILN